VHGDDRADHVQHFRLLLRCSQLLEPSLRLSHTALMVGGEIERRGVMKWVTLLVVAAFLSACSMDRYLCKQMQSREPECEQYR
jgi:hypothetical protein